MGRALGPTWVRPAFLALVSVWAVYVVCSVTGVGGPRLGDLLATWVYTGLMWSATALVALRAILIREERLAWTLLALGAASWSTADLLWTVHYNAAGNVPVPSLPDLFYYLNYPLVYVGLGMLVRNRMRGAGVALWLDGLLVGLTLAAICVTAVVGPIADATQGEPLEIVTTIGYPIADVSTLCLAMLALSLCGWRPGRALGLLLLYLGLSAVADGWYTYATTIGAPAGAFLDTLWPASALALSASAWQPWPRSRTAREGVGMLVVAGAASVIALALLVYDHYASVPESGMALAVLALLAAITRCGLGLYENVQLLQSSRSEALTDGLTGLGNRRRLMIDLEQAVARASVRSPTTLTFCDLDGFKHYNDTFGHGAGDALLSRLGERLARAVGDHGAAYRLGGDEFCVLLYADEHPSSGAVAAVDEALTEHGEGFSITASIGIVSLPADAGTATLALQVADERMYAVKESQRPSLKQQARELLMRVLDEREPELSHHVRDVADLALGVARRLGLPPEQMDEIGRAAELHDVGKIAVPDAILHKPGPLDQGELAVIRQHTVIGERILSVAPPLRPVGRLVRSSHERWDGSGYPDRLSGEDIPIGARIIAVCDAFDAMTGGRPYAARKTPGQALAELQRCAGTQFDPRIVATFAAEHTSPRQTDAASRAPCS